MTITLKSSKALGLFNMTPMFDMMFLLIIFFLVTSQFEQEERELDVQLPEGTEAMPLTARPKEVFINIDDQGRYYVDSKILSLAELEQFLRQTATNNPTSQTVIVRADKRAQWDYVAAAFRACNKAGIRDYFPAFSDEE
ncbi:MAG TPA: biopolymer transporter ExbD [Pirellulaceae bacterium]|nr:biopolymer transporter ExbD [Pirellulaceae bacterium]